MASGVQRSAQLESLVIILQEQPGFQDVLGQLLDEQRHAVGPGDDLTQRLAWHLAPTCDLADEVPRNSTPPEPVQRQPSHIVGHLPAQAPIRSASHRQQNSRVLVSGSQSPRPALRSLDRSSAHPLGRIALVPLRDSAIRCWTRESIVARRRSSALISTARNRPSSGIEVRLASSGTTRSCSPGASSRTAISLSKARVGGWRA